MLVQTQSEKMTERFRLPDCTLLLRIGCFAVCVAITANGFGQESHETTSGDEANEVYSGDKLLTINIRLDPDDWHALRISHRNTDFERIAEDPYIYYKAEVEIDGVVFKSVGVRKKGFFGSVVSTRPSLKIRFDKWNKGRDFHGLDQLTLNNNVQDPSQMHQYMAYWFFERAGAIAPRSNFAVVTVNGENLGIYSNVESIRDPFLKRVFKHSNGKLYEGYAGDFVDNESEFNRLVRKDGKPKSGRKTLERFRETLNDSSAGLDKIEEVLDLDAFITYWATEVLIGHWDSYSGNRNNFYFYRDPESKKFFFVPWGADSIFQDPGPFIQQQVPRSIKAVGAVCRRLWDIPEVQERYQNEMRRLLKEVWIEKEIFTEIERVQTMLRPHLTIDPAQVRNSVQAAKAFITARRPEFVVEMDGSPPKWPEFNQPLLEGAATPKQMEITGSFRTMIAVTDPENPFGNSTELHVTISGKEQNDLFKRVGVFAKPEQPGFIRPGYPVVSLIAMGSEGQKPWLLQFYIDPIRAVDEESSLPVDNFCVWAILVKGEFESPDSERRIFDVSGTLELNEFDQTPGGFISGTFKIQTQAFGE